MELDAGLKLDIEDLKPKIETTCNKISFTDTPEEEQWRISLLKELSQAKSKHLHVEGFSSDEIEDMLRFISIS